MPSAAPDLVIIDDATFRGPAGPVFPHTRWRLPAGERWALRGPSGGGKSLFVAALTGRLPRLHGTLRHPFLEGRRGCADSVFGVLPSGTIAVASMDQHRALLAAREFHQLRWHGSLSVGAPSVSDFLARGAVERQNEFAIRDDAGEALFAAARAREVDRFELSTLLPRPLLALSNGELHRVLVARALMLDPRLLIVDDPYAGLDARTRDLLTRVLDSLPASGTEVLHVAARDVDLPPGISHELELAEGRVVHAGPRGHRRVRAPTRQRVAQAEIELSATSAPTDTRAPVLELRGVTVRHGGITLLADIDLTVLAGERWALIGPNGAGKSTLLSLVLADHPQAHANHIVVCGRRLGPGTSIWDIKRCLGWLSPELEAHYPLASPLAEVVASGFAASLGLHVSVGAAESCQSSAWLDALGLADRAETAFGDVPRLAKRLALLARASVHGPKLLLLDEPCQGLDAPDRAAFTGALALALERTRAALIYVTHEPEELPAGVHHVLELEAGRVRGVTPQGTLGT